MRPLKAVKTKMKTPRTVDGGRRSADRMRGGVPSGAWTSQSASQAVERSENCS